MKVLHLSTFDIRGGAARSAYRFHQGMLRAGIDSQMLVRSKWGQDSQVHAFSNIDSLFSRIIRRSAYLLLQQKFKRQIKHAAAGFDPFSIDLTECGVKCDIDVDIINLHWVAGFVNPSVFFQMNPITPIVWRFSDLNPITGGCHYDSGCGRYLKGCNNCPQLGSSLDNDISSGIWKRKRRAFEHIPEKSFHLVAQSNWMAEQMRQSPIVGRFPITVIANGIDTEVYRPTPRPGLRTSLGIEEDEQVLLFVATSTQTRRKGLALLLDALGKLDKKIKLLSVGGNNPGGQAGDRHIWLGKIDNDHMLSAIYNIADLFIQPSLQDNLPNTAIEALACGTPVVGFESGGLCDIVEHGVTGRLVPTGDVSALVGAISRTLEDKDTLKRMRAVCRDKAVTKFDLPTQVGQLTDLYRQIIDTHKTTKN